jgi:hypothetical protein
MPTAKKKNSKGAAEIKELQEQNAGLRDKVEKLGRDLQKATGSNIQLKAAAELVSSKLHLSELKVSLLNGELKKLRKDQADEAALKNAEKRARQKRDIRDQDENQKADSAHKRARRSRDDGRNSTSGPAIGPGAVLQHGRQQSMLHMIHGEAARYPYMVPGMAPGRDQYVGQPAQFLYPGMAPGSGQHVGQGQYGMAMAPPQQSPVDNTLLFQEFLAFKQQW